MNYLWGCMLLIGITYGTLTGHLSKINDALIHSPKEAISLCISVSGVTALWTGIMKIAENTGLITQLSAKLRPFLRFLFPDVPSDSKAAEYISTNFLSNLLGLSWASTPSGLLAFQELAKLNKSTVPSNAMCTFLIINVSSLQLIPINMIAYRSQYGSPNPSAITGPALIATFCSTLAAVIFCRITDHQKKI